MMSMRELVWFVKQGSDAREKIPAAGLGRTPRLTRIITVVEQSGFSEYPTLRSSSFG